MIHLRWRRVNINSYANNATEQNAVVCLSKVLEIIPVCCSTDVVAERGEFHRFSTCVLNAYLTPVVIKYLDTWDAKQLPKAIIFFSLSIKGFSGVWPFNIKFLKKSFCSYCFLDG